MCLQISIEITGLDKVRINSIANNFASKDVLAIHMKARLQWLKKAAQKLYLSDYGEGCACNLLSDNADWKRDTWDMLPSFLPRLALTIERLYEQVPEGFKIQALWIGDKIKEERTVSCKEILDIVRAGKLGTKTRYKVS